MITETRRANVATPRRFVRLDQAGRWLRRRSVREALTFYLFISPWGLGLLCLTLFPFAMGVLISFTNYDGISPINLVKFTGFANYARALDDRLALQTFSRTVGFSLWLVPLLLIASMGLALLLQQGVKGLGAFRAVFYLPTLFPVVTTALIWLTITNKNAGLLNAAISLVRPGTAINWLGEYALLVLTLLMVWSGAGQGMVVFLAGLQGISRELKEAAMIDGASSWQVFRCVTLPLLTPVIFFQLLVSLIAALQIFVQTVLLTPGTGGGAQYGLGRVPKPSIYMYMNYVMVQILGFQRFGYGTALLWLFFVALVLVALGMYKTGGYWVYYEVEQD